MNNAGWKGAAELIGIAAIVASLVFVGFQIRQDRILARSELGSGTSEMVVAINDAMAEPEFAKVYAKMLDRPEDLSVDEMLQINRRLKMVHELFVRECYLWDRGVFGGCETVIRFSIPLYFGNRYAQSWWKQTERLPDLIPAWIDEEITSLDPDLERRRLEKIKAGL